MNRALLGIMASILLTSCASIFYKRVDDLASVQKNDKAFVVLKVDNRTKTGILNDPVGVTVSIFQAMKGKTSRVVMTQDKRVPLMIYEINPGTYGFSDFEVTRNVFPNSHTTYRFELDKVFYTYFTVRPGEVAYLGSYVLEAKDNPELTAGFDQAAVQDEVSAKNPLFEGYRWFSPADDRQSFF